VASIFAHGVVVIGSQGPGTSLNLVPFSSTSHGQLPDLGGINGETSQESPLHDTSGSYSGLSVSGFGTLESLARVVHD